MLVVSNDYATFPIPEEPHVPISEIFLMPVMLSGKQISVLKDDGCNKNILLADLVLQNRHIRKTEQIFSVINHSVAKASQKSDKVSWAA